MSPYERGTVLDVQLLSTRTADGAFSSGPPSPSHRSSLHFAPSTATAVGHSLALAISGAILSDQSVTH
jgi:hypothetical protein